MKVIVFDDDPSIGNLLKCFLNNKGHDVTVFENPAICPLYQDDQCTCPKDSPCADVVFIDNNMPQITGLELIQRQELMGCKLRTENKALMSAYLRPEDVKNLRDKGYQIITKPFNMDNIYKFMEECQQRLANDRDDTQH